MPNHTKITSMLVSCNSIQHNMPPFISQNHHMYTFFKKLIALYLDAPHVTAT